MPAGASPKHSQKNRASPKLRGEREEPSQRFLSAHLSALLCVALVVATLAAGSSGFQVNDGTLLLLPWRQSGGVPPPLLAGIAPRLQLPWQPLLTEEELLRGLSYYGSGTRLRNLAHKLLAGEPVTVRTIGGSVTTAAALHREGKSYSALLFQYINATFPHRDHVFTNGGIPGSSSSFFAPCVEHLIPTDVDLVTVEFAVNDKADASFQSPARRSYEQLLRRLLMLPGQPAVVLVHHYAWLLSAGPGVKAGLFYRDPEGQHTVMGHYYDVPSVSMRAAVWRLMREGVDRFKVDKVTRPSDGLVLAGPEERKSYFYGDVAHPEATGQQVLAELLIAPLARAIGEAATGMELAPRADPRLQGLPPALIHDNPVGSTSLCAMLEDFEPVVKAHKGFRFVAHKPEAPTFAEQKWSWTGQSPGDWVELGFDSRATDGQAQGNATVLLVHLKSYTGMGKVGITCTSGCSCQPGTVDGQWAQIASIYLTHQLEVTQAQNCRLRATIKESPKREQHRFSLSALMVQHI